MCEMRKGESYTNSCKGSVLALTRCQTIMPIVNSYKRLIVDPREEMMRRCGVVNSTVDSIDVVWGSAEAIGDLPSRSREAELYRIPGYVPVRLKQWTVCSLVGRHT